MTGRITAIAADRVTIDGATYEFDEAVRWLLETCERSGREVECVVRGGRVVQVARFTEGVLP